MSDSDAKQELLRLWAKKTIGELKLMLHSANQTLSAMDLREVLGADELRASAGGAYTLLRSEIATREMMFFQ